MLEGLDEVPWKKLEHAYGSAADVPGLLRRLLEPDPKLRAEARWKLGGNVFHQGTRYPAASYVVPFLIELCANPEVPDRGDLLIYWGSLIAGFFGIQERPCWGDGKRLHWNGEVHPQKRPDRYAKALHRIYLESLRGHQLFCRLLHDDQVAVRAGAAGVLACLPSVASGSLAALQTRLRIEEVAWVRAAMAFAFGELGAPSVLWKMLADDPEPAVQCMAACQLARIDPKPELHEILLRFVSEPVPGFSDIPGASGKSFGDAAFSLSFLPLEIQRRAIPQICQRLAEVRSFDTMPLVTALLRAAFAARTTPVTELDATQHQVLAAMVQLAEPWQIGNLVEVFANYGLPYNRDRCAEMLAVQVVEDRAWTLLSSGLASSNLGFLHKAREAIAAALVCDPRVFDRAPAADECWLLWAKALAETDPEQAVLAYQRALSLNPGIDSRISERWHLAELVAPQAH